MSLRGWIYVISNKAMPSMIKIGYTLKDPILRANELDNTGTPHPYDLRYEAFVYEPFEIEQRTHKELNDFRIGKEWFSCSISDAINVIRKVVGDDEIILERLFDDTENITEENGRYESCDDGTVFDKHTNRMWAATDNGTAINWINAKSYCANYRGGGYSDWRLPTIKELEELYTSVGYENKIIIAECPIWAAETIGFDEYFWLSKKEENQKRVQAAYFNFGIDGEYCGYQSGFKSCRVLPVRSVE